MPQLSFNNSDLLSDGSFYSSDSGHGISTILSNPEFIPGPTHVRAQLEGQADRQTGRQTDRQGDRQEGRQTALEADPRDSNSRLHLKKSKED